MVKHMYYNKESSKNYYKTLITCASFFARSEEAEILKKNNDNSDIQNVNYY